MFYQFLFGAAMLGLATAAPVTISSDSLIWVTEVPTYVRPYAIQHYLAGSQQIYRFPVTGPSSGNAFSLIQTNAPGSTALGVLPHLHEVHYENFFNFRGRFQLWADKNDEENTRVLLPGDFGAVPHHTTHTFQILDPDTEMPGVIQPGGFEQDFLMHSLASGNYSSSTLSPYDSSANATSDSAAGPNAALIATLEGFDVWAQPSYSPRSDAVNGAAPINSTWHTGSNVPASDAYTPFFIAKDYGPKYLNSKVGYQVIQPLVTGTQSAGNFTMSTITIERVSSNTTVPTLSYPGHAAFEVLDGELQVEMLCEKVTLSQGDVVFIPGNTTYKYYSEVAYTRFLRVSQGAGGLDSALIAGGESWDSPVWPTS